MTFKKWQYLPISYPKPDLHYTGRGLIFAERSTKHMYITTQINIPLITQVKYMFDGLWYSNNVNWGFMLCTVDSRYLDFAYRE